MFARKLKVEILEPDGPRACPIGWLDSFCMRSFTGRAQFDETLPGGDGVLEVGFRVDLEALRDDMEDWLTRKHGAGKPVRLRFSLCGPRATEAGPLQSEQGQEDPKTSA